MGYAREIFGTPKYVRRTISGSSEERRHYQGSRLRRSFRFSKLSAVGKQSVPTDGPRATCQGSATYVLAQCDDRQACYYL